jgi:hypothetical protein
LPSRYHGPTDVRPGRGACDVSTSEIENDHRHDLQQQAIRGIDPPPTGHGLVKYYDRQDADRVRRRVVQTLEHRSRSSAPPEREQAAAYFLSKSGDRGTAP